MTTKLYVSFAADLIAVVLMIVLMVRIGKLPRRKGTAVQYFRRLSLLVLIMSALNLLACYSEIQSGVFSMADLLRLPAEEQSNWVWTMVASSIVDIFMATVFLWMWTSFLCWSLFEDRDFIRRRFWFGFTPLIIGACIACVSIPMAVLSEEGFIFLEVAVCLYFAIRLYYFLIGLWLLREYKRQKGYLRFFNPWVFFIPVFAGWVLQDVFWWGVAALGCTIGLMLIYAAIVDELRYMDTETELYNREFVGYLKHLVSQNAYSACSAMTFTVAGPESMKDFASLLVKELPDDCEPIRVDDRRIVVLTNVPDRATLGMVIQDVKAAAEAEADCTLKKKKETVEEFMERVL